LYVSVFELSLGVGLWNFWDGREGMIGSDFASELEI
jgi:hypothetical protein